VGLRAGLDWCGKSRPTGIRSPDRQARRQSLYRLSYRAHCKNVNKNKIIFPSPSLPDVREEIKGLWTSRIVCRVVSFLARRHGYWW